MSLNYHFKRTIKVVMIICISFLFLMNKDGNQIISKKIVNINEDKVEAYEEFRYQQGFDIENSFLISFGLGTFISIVKLDRKKMKK